MDQTCDNCAGPLTPTYWQIDAPSPSLPVHLLCDPCHRVWLKSRQCKHPACENDGRYDSGYCGVCDILHNAGKGTLL